MKPKQSTSAKRRPAEQLGFQGFLSGPAPGPVTVELPLDFTNMPVGRLLADDRRVISCPACGRPCLAERRAKEWRFVHRGVISSGAKHLKFEPERSCRVEPELITALARAGFVTMTKHGTVLESSPAAPAALKEERARRSALREELGIE